MADTMTNNPSLAQQAEAMSLKLIKSEFESLRRDHPKYRGWKVYGPYRSSVDNRLRVAVYDGQLRITISYPKFIIECKYNRLLKDNEEIHHIDGDYSNNLLSNFTIVNSTEHRTDTHVDDSHGTRRMYRTFGCRCHICVSAYRRNKHQKW